MVFSTRLCLPPGPASPAPPPPPPVLGRINRPPSRSLESGGSTEHQHVFPAAEDERPGLGPGSDPCPGRVRDAVSVPGGAAAQPDPGQPAGVSSELSCRHETAVTVLTGEPGQNLLYKPGCGKSPVVG